MNTDQLEAALRLAEAVATAPGAAILQAFRSADLAVDAKADGSPVTAADKAAESVMRRLIRRAPEFGEIAILGEEAGAEGAAGRYRWLLDPIDGTLSFVRGLPSFGTIVALEDLETDEPLVGVIHLPFFQETYTAAKGLGARMNGRPIAVSAAADPRTAIVVAPDAIQFRMAGMAEAHRRLWEACDHLRGYTDVWADAMTVSGRIDAVVEPWMNIWDIRATQVLVQEAGGCHVTRQSRAEGALDSIYGAPRLVDRLAELLGF